MNKIDKDEIEIEGQDEEYEAYIEYDIMSYPSDLTLQGIVDLWDDNSFDIPDFQRKFVWSIEQASLLINSFLMGLPVPPTFFYVSDDNKSIIIDGLQRVSSIVYFFKGNFGEEVGGKKTTFRLKGLSDKAPYAGRTFDELDEKYQRKLRNSVLRAINIRQIKPDAEGTGKYHIFERLNTGGTPLKPQEIRNCVFNGDFAKLLKDINENPHWRKIIGKPKPDKHQRDIEMILRLFSLAYRKDDYEKPMKEFLNKSMKVNRGAKGNDVDDFKKHFPLVCKFIVENLGQKPFHIKKPLNVSVMDSVFCTLLRHYNSLSENIGPSFDRLCQDEAFLKATYDSTSDNKVIEARFELAKRYLVQE